MDSTKPLTLEQIHAIQSYLANLETTLLTNLTATSTDPLTSQFVPGDTAWMLASTALVLFMTLPGLILYYTGMIRKNNVLATAVHIFSIASLITALWFFLGYSLAFAPATANSYSSPVYGDGTRAWLLGMNEFSFHQLAPTIPEPIFCAYQLTFAIITPSLIWGSVADRMKYESLLVFILLWHFLVYCPIAHSSWHPDGFLNRAGLLDFAGGTVVHISSGISGLVATILLGPRIGLGADNNKNDPKMAPHSIPLTICGSCMLWIGWFGFNGGSALAANGRASVALLNTFISAGFGTISWTCMEWYMRESPSALGMVNGAIAGLVGITPGCGFVNPTGAFFIGLISGIACYFGSQIKLRVKFDDALDAFGVHAIGGTIGTLLTGFFANEHIGGADGVFYADTYIGGHQFAKQLYAVVVTAGWSAFASFIILFLIKSTYGLRVDEDAELFADAVFLREDAYANHDVRVPTIDLANDLRRGEMDHSSA